MSSSSSCSPFSSGQIQQLRQFVEALKLKPEILHDPQLGFLRDYLLSLGAVLPKVQSTSSDRSHTPMDAQSQDAQQQPETAPMEDDEHEPDIEEQEDPESEVELDMTGVIGKEAGPRNTINSLVKRLSSSGGQIFEPFFCQLGGKPQTRASH